MLGLALALGFTLMLLLDQTSFSSSPTIGLVVHSAADGIALGAASSDDSGSLEFIVFLGN
jgi:hypothetical protein